MLEVRAHAEFYRGGDGASRKGARQRSPGHRICPGDSLARAETDDKRHFFLPQFGAGIFFRGVPGAVEPPGWSGGCVRPSVRAGTTPVSALTPPQNKTYSSTESAVFYRHPGRPKGHRGLGVARAAGYPRSGTDGV